MRYHARSAAARDALPLGYKTGLTLTLTSSAWLARYGCMAATSREPVGLSAPRALPAAATCPG